jgi:hypothetical protein
MITTSEARDALLRSGYLLETRVHAQLRRRGYYVEANSVFLDRTTGISRELDIHGMRAYKAGPDRRDYLFVAPLIECVNNPEPLVLLTRIPEVPFLHHMQIQASGIPLKFPGQGAPITWKRFSDYLDTEKYHHYCRGRIATQFCSFQQKKQKPHDWMAWHDEAHFEAFRKLCYAIDYEIDEHFIRWRFGKREYVNIILYYPIVVLQGSLIEARASTGDVRLHERPHLMFRRSEFISNKERTFQIDVVQERALGRFLSLIDREAERLAKGLGRRHHAVRGAIDAIIRGAKKQPKPKLREAMTAHEF